jgi:hypothetical protein
MMLAALLLAAGQVVSLGQFCSCPPGRPASTCPTSWASWAWLHGGEAAAIAHRLPLFDAP